jgi:hypothetical protein
MGYLLRTLRYERSFTRLGDLMVHFTHYLALEQWKTARGIVGHYLKIPPRRMRKTYRVRLLNTTFGVRELSRLNLQDEVKPTTSCNHGLTYNIPGYNETSFIQVNRLAWESGRGLLPTLIHEIMHVVYPNHSEEKIRMEEKVICEKYGIDAAGFSQKKRSVTSRKETLPN